VQRDGEPATPDIRKLSGGVVYEDRYMRLRRDEIERRDGSRGTYAFVEKPDFALVIPAENDGFHLVEEYRYPIGRRVWSFPQGGWPSGQTGSPAELARLELSQETGLRARSLVKLGFLYCAQGFSSQGGHFFLATGLEPGPPDREDEEQDMRQEWVPRAGFEEMIQDGRITDDSTLAAYALLLISERRAGPGHLRPLAAASPVTPAESWDRLVVLDASDPSAGYRGCLILT
jgi:8-oxo-dGTP pyrophosphatase MutT (NUDIX family)